jgi:sensor c-di-GMP phosphodiesterase-like protein
LKVQPVIALSYLAGVLAIGVPVFLSVQLTDQLAQREQEAVAGQLADQALHRNETITVQVFESIRKMESVGLQEPCSHEAQTMMEAATLRYFEIQAVGYVRNNRIVCSSLGLNGVEVGPADYLTKTGAEVRLNRKLVDDERGIFRLTTSAKSGYTAIVHADLVFDTVSETDEVALGQISTVNLQPITQQGVWRPEWAKHLGDAKAVSFFDGDYVVAIRRSQRYTYFSYAALPASRLHAAWRSQAIYIVPLGLVAGLLLALSVYLFTRQQTSLRAQLRSALRREGELYLVYQPVVDLQTGQWVGAEALLRWQRPHHDPVSPDIFIPLAEHTHLMGQLTRKVISMAARDTHQLLKLTPDFCISLNFAASDLHDVELTQHLAHTLQTYGLRPRAVAIEATERTFIDAEQSRMAIQRLRQTGHRIAIDDFGTGYSSLSYLTKLEVDTIKIDRSFVETIGTGAVTSQVVSHIIEMGKSLNLMMVAEGVETEAQAAYLREHGVQQAQGWLYAKALPIAELRARLANDHLVRTRLSTDTN